MEKFKQQMINSLKKITLYFFPHCHNLSKNAKHKTLITLQKAFIFKT
jgi:hypothetical protein